MSKIMLVALFATLSYTAKEEKVVGPISGDGTEDLIGTWSLVSVQNTSADGTKTSPYGDNPEGLLIFCNNGQYAIQILRAQRPLVAANDKNKATPEENAALVKGNNSHFGTYVVDATRKTITFNVQHAFYPNWEGRVQVRSFTFKDGMLRYIVTNTTNGGAVTAEVVWKKD